MNAIRHSVMTGNLFQLGMPDAWFLLNGNTIVKSDDSGLMQMYYLKPKALTFPRQDQADKRRTFCHKFSVIFQQ